MGVKQNGLRVFQIAGPYFVAGIVLDRLGIVVRAADIVGYMARDRWTQARVSAYCAKKGWTLTDVDAASTGTSPQ